MTPTAYRFTSSQLLKREKSFVNLQDSSHFHTPALIFLNVFCVPSNITENICIHPPCTCLCHHLIMTPTAYRFTSSQLLKREKSFVNLQDSSHFHTPALIFLNIFCVPSNITENICIHPPCTCLCHHPIMTPTAYRFTSSQLLKREKSFVNLQDSSHFHTPALIFLNVFCVPSNITENICIHPPCTCLCHHLIMTPTAYRFTSSQLLKREKSFVNLQDSSHFHTPALIFLNIFCVPSNITENICIHPPCTCLCHHPIMTPTAYRFTSSQLLKREKSFVNLQDSSHFHTPALIFLNIFCVPSNITENICIHPPCTCLCHHPIMTPTAYRFTSSQLLKREKSFVNLQDSSHFHTPALIFLNIFCVPSNITENICIHPPCTCLCHHLIMTPTAYRFTSSQLLKREKSFVNLQDSSHFHTPALIFLNIFCVPSNITENICIHPPCTCLCHHPIMTPTAYRFTSSQLLKREKSFVNLQDSSHFHTLALIFLNIFCVPSNITENICIHPPCTCLCHHPIMTPTAYRFTSSQLLKREKSFVNLQDSSHFHTPALIFLNIFCVPSNITENICIHPPCTCLCHHSIMTPTAYRFTSSQLLKREKSFVNLQDSSHFHTPALIFLNIFCVPSNITENICSHPPCTCLCHHPIMTPTAYRFTSSQLLKREKSFVNLQDSSPFHTPSLEYMLFLSPVSLSN